MRRLAMVCAAVLVATGCDSSTATVTAPVPARPRYTVSGVAQDSAAARPVAGVVVVVGNVRDTSDFLGAYSITVDSGPITVAVNDARFEGLSLARSLSGNLVLNLPLRRLAPLVKDFSYTPGSSQVSIAVVDLQGASTVDRANGSSLFYEGPGFGFLAYAGPWSWSQQDATAWRVVVSLGRTTSTQFTWRIADTSGQRGTFVCTSAGTCQEQ